MVKTEFVKAMQTLSEVEPSLFQLPRMEPRKIKPSPVWLGPEVTLSLEVTRQELVP